MFIISLVKVNLLGLCWNGFLNNSNSEILAIHQPWFEDVPEQM